MKNRTILGIVCIILALVLAFAAAPLLNRMTDGHTDVIRIRRSVMQGRRLTEDDIETVSVGSFHLPDDVITDRETVVGRYAACDMTRGDYLFPSKLSDTADSASDVFRLLDGSEYAISVTIPSFAGGLSGKLQNGDIVSLIVCRNDSGGGTSFVPDELRYVRVITSTTSEGVDRDEVVRNEDGTGELPSTLTLLASPEQARLLAQYENGARIHAALVCRGNEELAGQYLAAQKAFLDGREGAVWEN